MGKSVIFRIYVDVQNEEFCISTDSVKEKKEENLGNIVKSILEYFILFSSYYVHLNCIEASTERDAAACNNNMQFVIIVLIKKKLLPHLLIK